MASQLILSLIWIRTIWLLVWSQHGGVLLKLTTLIKQSVLYLIVHHRHCPQQKTRATVSLLSIWTNKRKRVCRRHRSFLCNILKIKTQFYQVEPEHIIANCAAVCCIKIQSKNIQMSAESVEFEKNMQAAPKRENNDDHVALVVLSVCVFQPETQRVENSINGAEPVPDRMTIVLEVCPLPPRNSICGVMGSSAPNKLPKRLSSYARWSIISGYKWKPRFKESQHIFLLVNTNQVKSVYLAESPACYGPD